MRAFCVKAKTKAAVTESEEVTLDVASLPTLERVVDAARRVLGSGAGAFTLQYVDVEGDAVTIATDADVQEAVEYMADEQVETLVVWAAEATATTSAGATFQKQLEELIASAVAFALTDKTEEAEEKEEKTIASVLAQVLEGVKQWEVEDALASIKEDVVTILGNEALVAVLEEAEKEEAFGVFLQECVDAALHEGGLETLMTDKLEAALQLGSRVLTVCPELKPVVVRLVKACGLQLEAYNALLAESDPMPQLVEVEHEVPMPPLVEVEPEVTYVEVKKEDDVPKQEEDQSKTPSDEEEGKYVDLVHHCYQCDACDVLPIRGVRYRSINVDSFDLCSKCFNSKTYEETHGPFEAITEYKPVHFTAICDGCNANPITGVRYKSVRVENFDLCEVCEASGRWDTHEPFIKIKKPEDCPWDIETHFELPHGNPFSPSTPPSPPTPPAAPAPPSPPEQTGPAPPRVHPFVTCDGCGMNPMVGMRFKSTVVDNFDLCEVCKQSAQWDQTHGPFVLIEKPRDLRKALEMLRRVCRRAGRRMEREARRQARGYHHHHHWQHGGNCSSENGQTTTEVMLPCMAPCVKPSSPTLSSKYIRDVAIADGEKVAPDSVIVKAWRIQNNGETEWPLGCVLKMQTGRVGISPFEVQGDMVDVPVPTLAPGAEYTVEVRVRTPSDPGRYKAYWRMCDPSGMTFGHRLWIDVDVTEEAGAEVQPSAPPPEETNEAAVDVQSNATTEVSEDFEAPQQSLIVGVEGAFAHEVEVLASMGFHDLEENRQMLAACNGDVCQAIGLLLAE